MKIPVHYYTEVTDLTNINGLELGGAFYITNVGGRTYIVEVIE